MRLSLAPLRLSLSPALLALALPLAAALAFSKETLDKAPKSEGCCSPILRAQGTRREGYTEFSLRVETDPDFCKPGTNYRGKWSGVALGARTRLLEGADRPRGAGGGRAVPGRTVLVQPPKVLAAISPFSRELGADHNQRLGPSRGVVGGQPRCPTRGSRARAVAEPRVTPA
uniref:Uncharacterized protein n=1 Tax=Prolemur simus TaxID=1328070 RepID=A0A8C9DTE6_PROSS